MSRNPAQDRQPTEPSGHTAGRRLPLKGFDLLEDEWSPWYTDDFGLATRISWQRVSDRSIVIHNLAAAPDDPDPSSHFVHVTYHVDLPTGRKSRFEIQAEFLDGIPDDARRHVLSTIERAILMAEDRQRD